MGFLVFLGQYSIFAYFLRRSSGLLREFGTVQRFCMFCNGTSAGKRLGSPGKIQAALGCSGVLWGALGSSGELRRCLGGYGELWEALGSSLISWEALGGSGRLWESFGYLLK